MNRSIALSLCWLAVKCHAQFVGGIGGGGFTNCSSSFTVLPVELLFFTAVPEGQDVALHWATASELNNAGFQVERSSDGERFDAIMHAQGMGTTQQVTEYQEVDPDPLPGLSYYRLRQSDLDGTETLSKSVAVQREQDMPMAYPNPVHDLLHFAGIGPDREVEIIDPLGRTVRAERSIGEHFTLDATPWPAGCYTIRIIHGNSVRAISVIKY